MATTDSAVRGSCERRPFEVNSEHTRQSVAMLMRSPEFRQQRKMQSQGDSFTIMFIWAVLFVSLLVYVDFVYNVSINDSKGVFIGSAMRFSPFGLQLAMFVAAFFSCTWLIVAMWGDSYNDPGELFRIFREHVLATAALAFLPYDFSARPFLAQWNPAAPWLCVAPLATFLVGYLLFYRRFAGNWKRKAKAISPFFTFAPTFGAVMLAVWFVAGRLATALPRMPLRQAAEILLQEAQGEWASVSSAASSADPALSLSQWLLAHSALYQRAYVALLVFSVALVVAHVVGRFVMGLARMLLPSTPATWALALITVCGIACYLSYAALMTSTAAGGLGLLVTVLLLRGFDS